MRTQFIAIVLVAASLSRIVAFRNTPFYQQAENNNDLVDSRYSANELYQTSFSAPGRMNGDSLDAVGDDDDDDDDEDEDDDAYDDDVDDEDEDDDAYDDDDDDEDEDDDAYDDDDGVIHHNQVIDPTRHHKKKKGWVYLIRHGEKVKKSDKTGLSERGVKRAKCLMGVFGSRKSRARYPIDYILAQDFKPNGQRRRPFETVKSLAKRHHLPLDHHCDRDDTACAAHKIKKKTRKGKNILVVWEHARLSNIAKALGVKGLVYPSERYDIVFKIRGKKVHSIFSEECNGLDDEWFGWQAFRKGRHGRAPNGGRLIDDESWAET